MWAKRIPNKASPRVGVVWKANSTSDKTKSFELSRLHQLLGSDIELISLQKEVTETEGAWLDRMGVIHVEDAD